MNDHFLALFVADLVGAVMLWKVTRAGGPYPLAWSFGAWAATAAFTTGLIPVQTMILVAAVAMIAGVGLIAPPGRRDRGDRAPRHTSARRPPPVRALAARPRRPRFGALDGWFRGRRARICAGRGCRAPHGEGVSGWLPWRLDRIRWRSGAAERVHPAAGVVESAV